MSSIVFDTDEVLLFEQDGLPPDRNWFICRVRSNDTSYEIWVSEWNPYDDTYIDTLFKTVNKQEEAKEAALDLARQLNLRIPLKLRSVS